MRWTLPEKQPRLGATTGLPRLSQYAHQPAFLERFLAGASSVVRLPPFAGLAFTPPCSMLRRSASIRLTTLVGLAAGFSLAVGRPACFERISSNIAITKRY